LLAVLDAPDAISVRSLKKVVGVAELIVLGIGASSLGGNAPGPVAASSGFSFVIFDSPEWEVLIS
jgi:hypothetical protein